MFYRRQTIGGNAYNSVVSKCCATGNVSVATGSLSPIYSPDYTNPGATAGGIAGYYYSTSATTVCRGPLFSEALKNPPRLGADKRTHDETYTI